MSTAQPADGNGASPRRAISKRVRYEVMRRDQFACHYCGTANKELTVDHVIPTALGGSDDPSNLATACQPCNAGKASTAPDAQTVAQVSDDAHRWRDAMLAAAAEAMADRVDAAAYCEQVATRWDSDNDCYRRGRAGLPDNWMDTLEHWRCTGLPVELVTDAVGLAMRNKLVEAGSVWRYTCGIAWKRVAALQERAAELASGGDA